MAFLKTLFIDQKAVGEKGPKKWGRAIPEEKAFFSGTVPLYPKLSAFLLLLLEPKSYFTDLFELSSSLMRNLVCARRLPITMPLHRAREWQAWKTTDSVTFGTNLAGQSHRTDLKNSECFHWVALCIFHCSQCNSQLNVVVS